MKVAFDISKFGISDARSFSKTGVFRVTENLLQGLVSTGECDLTLCVSASYFTFYDALGYLRHYPQLSQLPLAHQPNYLKQGIYKVHQFLHSKIDSQSIDSFTGNPTSNFFLLLRKLSTAINRVTEPYCPLLDTSVLSKLDIYHSPYEPIPAEVHNIAKLQKFITVHDLIPLLFPQFFPNGSNDYFKNLVATITPDTWVLCVSESTKSDLCNHSSKINPARVFVTHLAASSLFYPCTDAHVQTTTRQKYGVPNAPYILSLSTLEPRKNIAHVVHSFSNLIQQEKISDLNLVLVGPKGWNYDSIFAEISSNSQLRDRIILTGFVDDTDLAAIYSGALAFVYMSLYEGFGLPPLEAMQCGIPVITSNTSSLPEVVGTAGILLNPTDSDGLQQSLLSLYNDSSLRAKLSQRSLEHAHTFSWEKCVRETINAYKLALSI